MHYYNSHMSVALSAQFEVMVKELASKPKWGPKTAAMFLAGPPKSARGCISRPLGCISLTHINAHSLGTCEQTADSKAHRAQGTSHQTAESEAAKPQAEGKGMSSNPVEPKDYSEDSKFVATTARTAARTASL